MAFSPSRRPSRTPRSRFTLGLLLLTAVTLLVLDLPGTGPLDPVRSAVASVFRPVRSAGNTVFRPLSNGWKGAFGYGELKDENAKLKAQLAERESEKAQIRHLEELVVQLNELNKIDVKGVPTRSAKVVSGPLSSFDHTVQIDRGSSHGVKRGMAVITGGIDKEAAGGQIMGRVVKVRSNSATVELITEPSFQIGVRDTLGGQIFTAQGRGRGRDLVIDGVDKSVMVAKGDVFQTSGIDRSAFPPDLQVGRVTSVSKNVSGQQEVRLKPTADLSSVLVKVVLQMANS